MKKKIVGGPGFGTALVFPLLAAAPCAFAAGTSASHAQLLKLVDQDAPSYIQTSRQIWEQPELGYHETRSSAALQDALRKDGFKVTAGVADEPTAFVASYGEGKPIIGILGEFDALPGLSQAAVPDRSPVTAGSSGHGCG